MLSGTTLRTGFLQENGARLVTGNLSPGQGFVYPKGSFHYQSNLGCDPVTFVSGLNSEDPGVATVAQRFFGIPPNVTDASIGDIGEAEVIRIAQSIPDSFAIGVQSCLDKCKIQRGTQPKTQQQPRVLGNGFLATNTTTNTSGMNHTRRSNEDSYNEAPEAQATPTLTIFTLLSSTDAQTLGELVFLLKIVICVLLSGYVFVWAYFVAPAWKNRKARAELQARTAASPLTPVQDVKE
jgi:hypothetical protein